MGEPANSPKGIAATRLGPRSRKGGVSRTGDTPAADDTRSAQAARIAGQQGPLFTDDVAALPEDMGFRGPTACAAAGITYRQLDYWARTKLVEPSISPAYGSGTLYGFHDILILKIVKRLLDIGVSIQGIRQAVRYLRARGVGELCQSTLISDGASVYECSSPDEVVDLLQGGQGVFGIAVDQVWREVESSLTSLPGEGADEEQPGSHAADELARRRRHANSDKRSRG
jgi:DNA-binding transcriptional MerR regulator